MDWLKRESAPLSVRAWQAIDEAVMRSAKQELAARRIADFEGPKGWEHVAEPLGTRHPVERPRTDPGTGRSGAQRSLPDVMLLCEMREDFSLSWESVDAFERGARVLDTVPAERAAREVALAEDDLALQGAPGSAGFLRAEAGPKLGLGDWSSPGQVAADLLSAVARLDWSQANS